MFSGSTHVSDVKEAIIDADALIVKFARITREVITCGRRLRVIGKHGIGRGYDSILTLPAKEESWC